MERVILHVDDVVEWKEEEEDDDDVEKRSIFPVQLIGNRVELMVCMLKVKLVVERRGEIGATRTTTQLLEVDPIV